MLYTWAQDHPWYDMEYIHVVLQTDGGQSGWTNGPSFLGAGVQASNFISLMERDNYYGMGSSRSRETLTPIDTAHLESWGSRGFLPVVAIWGNY